MRGFVLILAASALLTLGALALASIVGDGVIDFLDVLGAILAGLPVAAVVSAAVLIRARRRPEAQGLPQFRERGDVALVQAVGASVGAFLGISRIAGHEGRPFLPPEVSLGLLVFAIGLASAYPMRWLYLYLRGRLY